MKNLNDSLKTQEVVAQEQKTLRIRQIQEALQYANQAQVSKPQIQQAQDVTCEWGDIHQVRMVSF
ncbi:regulator of length of O-antigen component of lipopolysaccharide chains [Escherichia coli]|nr:regulator of length of O-antigen component of lipopolysaccharide chains [Escherichia coli]CAD5557436.1 regulator of length of O-antigen component of lipopolysaccharide chains [Escherichia coli]